jgi:hypothetical protein
MRPTMAFPSPDPLWILELVKVLILLALGVLLLIRWFRAESRFYTDIPFLFALGFLQNPSCFYCDKLRFLPVSDSTHLDQ